MHAGESSLFEDLFGDPLRAALRAWAVGMGRGERQIDDRLKALLAPGAGEQAGGLGDADANRIAEIGEFDAVERRKEASVGGGAKLLLQRHGRARPGHPRRRAPEHFPMAATCLQSAANFWQILCSPCG